jgi:hypothetical protein
VTAEEPSSEEEAKEKGKPQVQEQGPQKKKRRGKKNAKDSEDEFPSLRGDKEVAALEESK